MAKPREKFKTTKVKMFFFFLLLALIFWILTKFSRDYTATAAANIVYESIPNQTLLADGNTKKVTFDITTNGFELMFYKLKAPTVPVEVSKYYKEGDKQVKVSKNELIKLISEELDKGIAVKNLSVEDLVVNLDMIFSKKIPVIATKEISFKNGFNAVDSLKIEPDSVTISGPSKILDGVKNVKTKPFVVKNLEKNLSKNVSLKKPDNKTYTISPEEVTLSLHVKEFTQKEITLPLQIINLPAHTTIKLIPEIVTVTFLVSLNNYKNITKEDFRIVCDYSERNDDQNFMISRLVKKPAGILHLEISDKKIDYLVFK